MKMDTQLEVYRNLRKLPKIVKELAKIKSRFQVNEDRLNAFRIFEEYNNMDIGTKVIDIIAEQAILDLVILPLKTLDSLGIDSMGLVESIFEIEEAFDIKFL